MTPKIEIFGQKFAHFDGSEGSFLTILGGQESRFLDFFKVVLELFKKCLGIVFDDKMSIFGCIFSSKGR